MSAPADRLLSPAFSCKRQRKRIASRAYTTVAPATALLALLAVILVLQPVQMLVWAFLPPVTIPSSSSSSSSSSFSSSSSISRSPPPSPLFLPSSRLSTLHLGPLYGGRDDEKAFRKVQQSKRQLRVGRLLQSTVADVIRKGYPIKTTDLLDDRIRSKISVVDVECSPDLKSARVEVSIFGETVEKREAYIWLVNNAKAIRFALAQEMKDFRHTPQLFFKQGDLGAGSDMFSLLDKLAEEREALEREGGGEEWEEEWDERRRCVYLLPLLSYPAGEGGGSSEEEEEEEGLLKREEGYWSDDEGDSEASDGEVVWEDEDEEDEEDDKDIEWDEDDIEWEDEKEEKQAPLTADERRKQIKKDREDAEALIGLLERMTSQAIAEGPQGKEEEKGEIVVPLVQRKQKKRKTGAFSSIPSRVDVGGGGLGDRPAGWTASQPYVPGALEAELEAEIEALRLAGEEEEKGAGMDGEAWGEEDDDDEDDDEDDEDYEEEAGLGEEEEEEGEEGGLIDWPVEGEGEEEDWGALTADGWIDMDAILDEAEGQDDIDALLKKLEGMPASGEDGDEEDDGDNELGRKG
ncbi:ribosome-binding factor a [Nannochloropsis oceanica]